MNDQREEAIRKISTAITKMLMKEGRLIELGFRLFILHSYTGPDLVPSQSTPLDMPKEQYDGLRMAFFSGAQHLFGSLTTGLDDDDESTEENIRKMELIQSELDWFIDEFAKAHGLDHPKWTGGRA